MYSYIARRLAFGALTIVGVSIMVFVVMRILPGDPLVAIFSKRTWDKLNETERELVRSASLEAQAYERKVSREMDVSSRQALAKHGMQINEVAPEEIERMREQVRPTVEKLVAEYGPELMAEMNAEIAKVRNAQ